MFTCRYDSPLGAITLASTQEALTGLWFDGQKYDQAGLDVNAEVVDASSVDVLAQTVAWLDTYFQGNDPGALPPCNPQGSAFRKLVWQQLAQIPYGELSSYGQIAKQLEQITGKRQSARAIGGAVGHNPISIILPCHRVVGAQKNLTGYAGGLDKKIGLLKLEGFDMSQFKIPTQGTAL